MRATRVWKRRSRGVACPSARLSQPIVSTGATFSLRICLVNAYISSQFGGGSTLTLPFAETNFFPGALRAFLTLPSACFGDDICAMDTSLLSRLMLGAGRGSSPLFLFLPATTAPLSESESGAELNSDSDSPFSSSATADSPAPFLAT
jgi:hypothetical protein